MLVYRLGLDGAATTLAVPDGLVANGQAIGPPPGVCRSAALSVPTASPLGLSILAIGVAWAGSLLLRRRRQGR